MIWKTGAIFCLAAVAAGAQPWDPGARLADSLADAKIKITFEQRGRYEIRTGTAFRRAPDVATGLYRTRLGMSFTPVKWLKAGGMVQDARAPWYGPNAPANLRDPAGLYEAWFELFPG